MSKTGFALLQTVQCSVKLTLARLAVPSVPLVAVTHKRAVTVCAQRILVAVSHLGLTLINVYEETIAHFEDSMSAMLHCFVFVIGYRC